MDYPKHMTDEAKRLHALYFAQDTGLASYDQAVSVGSIAKRNDISNVAAKQVRAFIANECVVCFCWRPERGKYHGALANDHCQPECEGYDPVDRKDDAK